jgi:hypothetical protein
MNITVIEVIQDTVVTKVVMSIVVTKKIKDITIITDFCTEEYGNSLSDKKGEPFVQEQLNQTGLLCFLWFDPDPEIIYVINSCGSPPLLLGNRIVIFTSCFYILRL